MTIETFPTTTLGAAAAAVVEKIAPKRKFEAVKVAPGEKIAADGVYDIEISQYHSDCCAGPSISSSGLRMIETKSPAHYWDVSYLNPNRIEQDVEPNHFSLGRAAHVLLLGEAGFARQFAIRPKEFDSWRTKDSKAWRAEQIAAGKSVLVPDDVETIKGIAHALSHDPLIKSGLLNGEVERSIICKDKETGVWLKSRPDALPVNADLVVDLKTCASATAYATRQSIREYAYHMQLALTGMLMREVIGHNISDEDYVLVFVETKRPYCVNVKPIDPSAIFYGRCQVRRAIRKFAECLNKGHWPGYEDNGLTASLPKFMTETLDAEIKNGLLPEVA